MSIQKRGISLWLSLIMIFSMVFLLTSCGKTTVDISDYVTVTYDSYNTMGSANVNIDYTGLNSFVDTETVNEYISKFPDGQQSIAYGYSFNFTELLDIKFKEDYSNLSNGDKVIVTIGLSSDMLSLGETMESMQKALKIRIPETEIEFTVKGLQEAKILDLLSIAAEHIEYTGASGNAKAEVKFPIGYEFELNGLYFKQDTYTNNLVIIYNNMSLGDITFYCDDAKTLSNGDTFELYCSHAYNLDLSAAGFDAIKKSVNITVSDLGEYVTSKDMLTDELKKQIVSSLSEMYPAPISRSFYWGTLKPTAVSNNPAIDSGKLFSIVQYSGFLGTSTVRCEAIIIKNPDNTYSVKWIPVQVYNQEKLHDENYDIEEIQF